MNILIVLHVLVTFLLMGVILLQPGESGFNSVGGMMSGGEHYHTRRGVEKILFYATFVLMAIFAVLSILLLR